jgi:thiol-disulfide isomerase/thioredoxin
MGLFTKNSGVIQLNPKNFNVDGSINHPALHNSKGMVLFFADWCGYCKLVAPEYIKTSIALGNSFPMFVFDCVKYQDFAQNLGIKGYPTIMDIDRKGGLKNYTGGRSQKEFLDHVCKVASTCR